MHPTAIQTKYRPKTHTCPLWIFHSTFTTFVIPRYRAHSGLIGRSHLHHDYYYLCVLWSNNNVVVVVRSSSLWQYGYLEVCWSQNETKLRVCFASRPFFRLRVVLLSRMRAAIGNDYDNDGLLGHHGHVVVVGRRPTEMRDGIILGGTVEAIPPEICAGACQKTVRAALPAISFGSKSKVFVSFWVRIQKVFVSLINKVFVSFGIQKVFVLYPPPKSKIQHSATKSNKTPPWRWRRRRRWRRPRHQQHSPSSSYY